MYIFPDMIDLGLLENQEFPSPEHRQVAQALALGNPHVKERDTLTAIVQEIIAVPIDRIKLVTLDELPITRSYIF